MGCFVGSALMLACFFFSRSFLIRLVRAGAGHLFAFRTHVFRVCVQRVTVAAA